MFFLSIVSLLSGMTAGDSIELLVPDLSYFPDEPQIRRFTVADESSNAYWIVQDTTWFDLPGAGDDFQLVWGNLVTQETIDSIAAQFEGASGMYTTVIEAFGGMQETVNNDEKIWIVFADIPDYYPVPGTGYNRLGNWLYTWPEDFDGDSETGNNHDIFYVNLSPYKNLSGGSWAQTKRLIYTWSVASGLGQIMRMAANPVEEKWVVRGVGAYTQHLCFGVTSALNGAIGVEGYLNDFAKAGGIELPSWWSGQYQKDFSANLGGEFLWFMYIAQRFGEEVVASIVQSNKSGMDAIAFAIDPAVSPELAKEQITYPLYEDWIITNLISPIAETYENGDYHYKFLDGTGYEFTILDQPASFLAEFDEYPIPTWIAPHTYGISAQEFASQYADFSGNYLSGGDETVHFNGMFNQNDGSGANIDGQWTVFKISMDEDSNLISLDSLEFDDMFNGTIELEGERTFLALTCNNQGGTANIRYTLSQDTASRSVFTTVTANPMHAGILRIYTSLMREDDSTPDGFDWVGPNVSLSRLNSSGEPDSTATVSMQFLEQTIWYGTIEVWTEGNYIIVPSGFDSLGRIWSDTLNCTIVYSSLDSLSLQLGSATYSLDGRLLPVNSVVSMHETDVDAEIMQSMGVVSKPISISAGNGLLSYQCDEEDYSVFMLLQEEWVQLDCYRVGQTVSAFIEDPGTYVLGVPLSEPPPVVADTPCLLSVSANPFADALSISFSLPHPELASVGLYDLTGRRVALIHHGDTNGGVNVVSWSGNLPSGVYFAVLQVGYVIESIRLVKI